MMRKHLPTTMAIIAAAMLVTGCEPGPFTLVSVSPVKAQKPQPKDKDEEPAPSYLEKTSLTTDEGDSGAVAEAMAWMERYTKEVETRTRIEKDKRALEDKNRELSTKLAKAENELKRTQQELDEANAMMLRLNADLKAWKKDVLGYRSEMRAAHKQTVTALGRVLQLLGGEVPTNPLTVTPTVTRSSLRGSVPRTVPPAAKEPTNASKGS
jgi:hypothetical protein